MEDIDQEQLTEDDHDLLSWFMVSDQLSFDNPGEVGVQGEFGDLTEFGIDDDGSEEPGNTLAQAGGSAAGSASRKRGRSGIRGSSSLDSVSITASSAGQGNKKPRGSDDVRLLEEKIQRLQDENSALQAHVDNVRNRTTEIQRHRVAMEKEMAEKMKGCEGDADREMELSALCQKYSDIYADYGQYRQKEVKFHLDRIEHLLVPTQVTKMSLWTLQQEASFYQPGKSPLWDSISKALEITPEQLTRIQNGRQRIKALLAQLQESLNLVSQLRTSINKRHAFFDEQCGGVQQIATPSQMVKFLLWCTEKAQRLSALSSLGSPPEKFANGE